MFLVEGTLEFGGRNFSPTIIFDFRSAVLLGLAGGGTAKDPFDSITKRHGVCVVVPPRNSPSRNTLRTGSNGRWEVIKARTVSFGYRCSHTTRTPPKKEYSPTSQPNIPFTVADRSHVGKARRGCASTKNRENDANKIESFHGESREEMGRRGEVESGKGKIV